MSVIPGDPAREGRRNFHDKNGRHLFPHPDTYEPRRSRWTGWEKAYAAHLDRHRQLADNPEPMPGDPQVVTDLFAHIECLKQVIKKEQQLIIALRQRAAEHPDADELELEGLRRAIRREGS